MEFESFVLAAVTTDLAEEPAARSLADAIEFRLDLADAPLDQLEAYAGELPIIATNRVAGEGGGVPDGAGRLETLADAVAIPSVEAVDLELATVEAGEAAGVLAAADTHEVAVIASAHDFDGTPPQPQLADTLRAAASAADVGKLAVTAADVGDVLSLLEVTLNASRAGHTVATMAMGATGRHSRAVAPIYGSRIGYAPITAEEATAPGQYDLESLAALLDALRVR